jgi:hypothetical protein
LLSSNFTPFPSRVFADILIMDVGLIYSIRSSHIDGGRWLREAATAFRDNVVSIFKGTHVFRIELTPTYPTRSEHMLDDLHQAGNKILAEVFGEVVPPPRVKGVPGDIPCYCIVIVPTRATVLGTGGGLISAASSAANQPPSL